MALLSQALPQASSAASCSSSSDFEFRSAFSEFKQVPICHSSKNAFIKIFSGSQPSWVSSIATGSSLPGCNIGVKEIPQDGRRGCQIFSLETYSSPTHAAESPFTEKYSPKKSQGKGLNSRFLFPAERNFMGENEGSNPAGIVKDSRSSHRDNLAGSTAEEGNSADLSEVKSSQLPELREVLTMLRKRWGDEEASGKRRGPGNVFLVGTGPGDPELLTVKALRLMQTADLVLYDRLVSTDILDLVHAGARLLYVGKTSGYHSRTQEEIHELLLNFAEAGAMVVRLKGGDPLVFGRGGEEMDFLQDQGIQVKVVPGITAASGIAAELGIPLTHRGAANSVRFLTGHSRKGGDDPLYVAEQAADPDSTLVIYMGLATLPGLATKLMANGLSPDTPAAAVERGTTAQQRTVFSTLSALPSEVARAELVSPTLIFIGQVVALSPYWPSDAVSEDATRKDFSLHNSSLAKSGRLGGESRHRLQRGPDLALPSQQ